MKSGSETTIACLNSPARIDQPACRHGKELCKCRANMTGQAFELLIGPALVHRWQCQSPKVLHNSVILQAWTSDQAKDRMRPWQADGSASMACCIQCFAGARRSWPVTLQLYGSHKAARMTGLYTSKVIMAASRSP